MTSLNLNKPPTLAEQGAKIVRDLPPDQLQVDASTTDFKTVDAAVTVQKSWRNAWGWDMGVGAWVSAKFGAGKPKGAAGVNANVKF